MPCTPSLFASDDTFEQRADVCLRQIASTVIDWENGVLHGGSEPRKDGHAAGF